MIHSELLQSIYNEVEKLPGKRQQLFRMIYFEGLKMEEIAEQPGISVFSVKEHKAKELGQLRLRFTDQQLMIFFLLSSTLWMKQ
jgi:DNA-directed RNA polymerase specialized sigma24 family protein